ncbi:MAG TPA: CoA-binding protein [Bacteroidia bacterium]|jgi:predicted CoA-binding protein|nr:CoA-binding protein [Bacteroidia bacterium]
MKTVVLGASDNPERTSFTAVKRLLAHGDEVIAVGIREAEIHGVKIQTGKPEIKDVDTLTLYIGPRNQPEWYDYILKMKPKRIIFNPGTENPEFEEMCRKNGIEVVVACTLVMLSVGNF